MTVIICLLRIKEEQTLTLPVTISVLVLFGHRCSSVSSVLHLRMPSKRTVREGERFKCPYPGCKRSFAELWRLKVHYRAPPDVRGSGKERGHGQELSHCPQCGARLLPGKHHIQCSGARAKRAEVRGFPFDAICTCAAPEHCCPHCNGRSRTARTRIIFHSGDAAIKNLG